jgi:hypothetical protein
MSDGQADLEVHGTPSILVASTASRSPRIGRAAAFTQTQRRLDDAAERSRAVGFDAVSAAPRRAPAITSSEQRDASVWILVGLQWSPGEQWVGVSGGAPVDAGSVACVIFELAVTATSRCVFRTPVVSRLVLTNVAEWGAGWCNTRRRMAAPIGAGIVAITACGCGPLPVRVASPGPACGKPPGHRLGDDWGGLPRGGGGRSGGRREPRHVDAIVDAELRRSSGTPPAGAAARGVSRCGNGLDSGPR